MTHFDSSFNTVGLSISRDESEPSSPSRRYSSSTAEETNGLTYGVDNKFINICNRNAFFNSEESCACNRGRRVYRVYSSLDTYKYLNF